MSRNFFSIFKKRNSPVNSFASATQGYAPAYTTPINTTNRSRRFNLGVRGFKPSKQLTAVLVIFVIAILGFAFWFKRAADNIQTGVLGTNSNSSSQEIAPPYASKQIDKEMSFPLRNEKGEKVSEFKYIVQNAE